MTKRNTERRQQPHNLRDGDAIWLKFWQKAANAFQHWRKCDLPQCRRSKSCIATAVPIPCNRLFPRSPPMSNDERAAVADDFKQALNKRMAELLREEGMRDGKPRAKTQRVR